MAKLILKEYLKERGIKCQFLVDRIHISQAQFSQLINNKTAGIQFDTLQEICDILKCDISDILVLEKDIQSKDLS